MPLDPCGVTQVAEAAETASGPHQYAIVADAGPSPTSDGYLEVFADADGDMFGVNQTPDEDLLDCLTSITLADVDAGTAVEASEA